MRKFTVNLSLVFLLGLAFLLFTGCGSGGGGGTGGGTSSTRAVSGSILGADGSTPVSGAFVVLNLAGARASVMTTTATDQGAYQFTGVSQGTFRASFWLSRDDYENNPDNPQGGLNINTATGNVSLNLQTGIVAPWISLVTPPNWNAGQAVTLTGTAFGSSQGTSTLTFNGIAPQSIVSWSDTSVVCRPAGSTSEPVILTVDGRESNYYLVSSRKWTVMVYLDADNNLERYGKQNMDQMIAAGNSSNVDILVLWDGYTGDYGLPAGTRLYKITQGAWVQLADYGELDMGDPQTLINFVNYVTQNYPADHFLLDFWNHGGGWRLKTAAAPVTKNVCWDDTNGGDSLSLPEIYTAMGTITGNLGKKIDLVGFDACLMGMLEVAYNLKDSVGVMTASEESEPGEGWPYDTILNYLLANPLADPAALGREIARAYLDYYGAGADLNYSVLNLNKTNDLIPLVNNFALKLQATDVSQTLVRSIGHQTYYFSDDDFIDLRDFARRIRDSQDITNPELLAAASQLYNALLSGDNNYIVYADYSRGKALSDTCGLSIYFPTFPSSTYSAAYDNILFAQQTCWADFLKYNFNLSWVKTWGGVAGESSAAGAYDNAGNLYLAGSTDTFGAGNYDAYLIKYNSTGNLLWRKTWGGAGADEARALTLDSQGNCYVTGGTNSFGMLGSEDVFLLKYDSDGDLLWQKTWGGGQYDTAFAVKMSPQGDVYVAGTNASFAVGQRDTLLLKYAPNGDLIWARSWGLDADEEITGLAVNSGTGEVFLCGFTDVSTIIPQPYESLLMKYDADGNLLGLKTWGGSSDEIATGIYLSSGNLYLSGVTESFGQGGQDAFLLKYNSSLDLIWQRAWGGSDDDEARAVAGSGSNIYLTGSTDTFGAGVKDLVYLKYDTSGNLLIQRSWGGPLDDRGRALAVDGSANVFFAGLLSDALGSWRITDGVSFAPSGLDSTMTGITSAPPGEENTPPGVETSPVGSTTFAGATDSLLIKNSH